MASKRACTPSILLFAPDLSGFFSSFGLISSLQLPNIHGHAVLDEAEDTLCAVHLDDEQALKGLDVLEG